MNEAWTRVEYIDPILLVRAKGQRIVIEPIENSLLSFGETFKVKNPIPAENIRKHIWYGEGKK